MIELRNVSYRTGEKELIRDFSLRVKQGESVGLIGPNGSGKTTLIKLLSGLLRPTQGEALLQGKSAEGYPRKELARWLAVLSQEILPPYPITVYDAVMMGRYPHLAWMHKESRADHELVERVLEQTGLFRLKEQPLNRLSGGERQRTAIARAMVQEPLVLLLDEPTTYLDVGSQIQVMDIVKKWQRECGLTVLMVLHDLNLAAQYCDRLALMHEGRLQMLGDARDVIRSGRIKEIYRTEMEIVDHPLTGIPQILLTGNRI